jgi:integrase
MSLTQPQLEYLSERKKIQAFIETLETGATKNTYAGRLKLLEIDDSFIDLSAEEQQAKLTKFILEKKGKVGPQHLRSTLAAVKGLLNFYDSDSKINWKKLTKLCGKVHRGGTDRPPKLEEIRKLLDVCDTRGKALVLLLVSSGIRIGAISTLRISDYEKLENGIAKLRVYARTNEQYTAFVSSEAVKAIDEYLEARKRDGEVINQNSPLFRDLYVRPLFGNNKYSTVKQIHAWTERPAGNYLQLMWRKCGVVSNENQERCKRREFQGVHGFRKYFKTILENAGVKGIVIETLMGHSLSGDDSSYYRPTEKELQDEYIKGQSSLFVSEALQVKNEFVREKTAIFEGVGKTTSELEAKLKAQAEELAIARNLNEQVIAYLKSKDPDFQKQVFPIPVKHITEEELKKA